MGKVVFDFLSAEAYLNRFSDTKVNIGYAVSEGAILAQLVPFLKRKPSLNGSPKILEIGAGPGRSTYRLKQSLTDSGINYDLITTEVDWNHLQVAQDSVRQSKSSASQEEVKLVVPQVQMAAEMISSPNNSFDSVIGSQVIHWVNNLPMFFTGAFRVLKPDGLFIQAGSGIIKNMDEKLHFTDHEVYQYFQNCVREQLIEKGYWNDASGEFSPKNPKVNGKFHRYDVDEIMNLMRSAGFTAIEKSIHDVPVTSDQMIARMELGAVRMFLFQGSYAEQIPKEDIKEIVDKAREITMKDKADLLINLDNNPAFDSVILFAGKKPKS